jgi:outer membrane immunogenic protein
MFMKRWLLLLAGIFGGICLANAQAFHGGVLAGFTATQVDGDTYGGYNKAGFQGGVFVNARLSDLFSAQLEIKYTGKGARKPVTSIDPEIYNLTLHYIDVPVSVNVRVKQIGSAELGLVPAYLFSVKGEDSGGYFPSSDYLVTFKKFDLSFMMGINIKVFEKLKLNLRYTYSLLSIRSEKFENGYYTWFGNLFGPKTGQYNNCLLAGLYFQLK